MLREEATVLTGMLIGLSAIDFRWGLGVGASVLVVAVGCPTHECAHPYPLIPTPFPVGSLFSASA